MSTEDYCCLQVVDEKIFLGVSLAMGQEQVKTISRLKFVVALVRCGREGLVGIEDDIH